MHRTSGSPGKPKRTGSGRKSETTESCFRSLTNLKRNTFEYLRILFDYFFDYFSSHAHLRRWVLEILYNVSLSHKYMLILMPIVRTINLTSAYSLPHYYRH
jgi:hypothetical protein